MSSVVYLQAAARLPSSEVIQQPLAPAAPVSGQNAEKHVEVISKNTGGQASGVMHCVQTDWRTYFTSLQSLRCGALGYLVTEPSSMLWSPAVLQHDMTVESQNFDTDLVYAIQPMCWELFCIFHIVNKSDEKHQTIDVLVQTAPLMCL